MTLLDLFIILLFLVVCLLAHFAITPLVLAILVAVLCVERVLKGERL